MIKRSVALLLVIFSLSHFVIAQGKISMSGGEYAQETGACLLEVDRAKIKRDLAENIFLLEQQGIISSPNKSIVSFEWPLAKATDFDFNSYYGISNYVDHDPDAPGGQYGDSNLDYNCGNRSYDTSNGYNHAGIDIFLWPFEWYMVENDFVEVVAAAPGIIIDKFDGNEDDHCSCEGSWNAVYVRHDDGSVAWYGHLKRNSLTSKNFGEFVEVGEYLGVVASSGCSTGPHLHFEVYDSGDNLVDPYAGACNSLNTATWWADQRSYRKSTINAVLTHSDVPVFGCPASFEEPMLENEFEPLERVYAAFYYADQMMGQTTVHRILTPSGDVWREWTHTSPNTYNASYWYRSYILPANAEHGEWTVEADYEGETISYNFYVGVLATHDLGNAEINIFPNPATDKINVESDDKNLQLLLFDSQGKLLIAQEKLTMDISSFPKGVYFLSIEDLNGNTAVEKIIKL